MSGSDALKARAAERALRLLKERPVRLLGLGTGSTAEIFVRRLAEAYRGGALPLEGCVPTSRRTEQLARELGLPLTALEEHPELELTVDGADEVDPQLNLLKGGGGAHTREKIVAWASKRYWILVDESKLVARLGERHPVPLEVLPFAHRVVEEALKGLGGEPRLRLGPQEKPFETDEGNWVLDCAFPEGLNPADVAEKGRRLKAIPGVVEHGLFPAAEVPAQLRVIVAGSGGVRVLTGA